VHFQDYTAFQFSDKLSSTSERAGKKSSRADEDAAFLAHGRKIFHHTTEDSFGEPVWKGSIAHAQLVQDIIDEKNLTMSITITFCLCFGLYIYNGDWFFVRFNDKVVNLAMECRVTLSTVN
jgi:hypothetical protein